MWQHWVELQLSVPSPAKQVPADVCAVLLAAEMTEEEEDEEGEEEEE